MWATTAAAFQVALAIAIGIPLAALVPPLLGRMRRPAILVVVLAGCYIAAFAGLILVAGQAVWVFSALIGIGTGAFPLALTSIALLARTSMATTSLSAFTQCVGYLIASVGPFGFGVLNGLTGGWTVPLLALCAVVVVQAVAGCLAVRPRYVEDELPPQPVVGGETVTASDEAKPRSSRRCDHQRGGGGRPALASAGEPEAVGG